MSRPIRPRSDSSCDDFKAAYGQMSPSLSGSSSRQLDIQEDVRPAGPSRARSGLENLLPAGIVRRSKGRRPPATPHMERSISSMTDSFSDMYGSCSRHDPNVEGLPTPEPATGQEDSLTPISNWAHLNYIKTQRNALRADLKAQQTAGAEAKRSVASLRRLAFRMAVNISVKEKQIATSARNLAKNRKAAYVDGRGAEKRLEELQRALRIEEKRSEEILEALERASMLTLEYANPKPESSQRRVRNPLSPPPSPPTRMSTLSMTPMSNPRTPPRSASSSWQEGNWELTPKISVPSEIRTSDSRLIRAKRDSDHALTACRSRIHELQSECAKRKEHNKDLEDQKANLKQEIEKHQSRIHSLEASRAAVEETLESTRLQLEVATGLEDGLKQSLRKKNKALLAAQQSDEDKEKALSSIREELAASQQQLTDRHAQHQELDSRYNALTKDIESIREQLENLEQTESILRSELRGKDKANEDLAKRLDRGTKYEQILQKKIVEHEQEILGNLRKIDVGGGLISTLRQQLKSAEDSKATAEKARTDLRLEIGILENGQQALSESHDQKQKKLNETLGAKNKLQYELSSVEQRLSKELEKKQHLLDDLTQLRSSHENLQIDLEDALKLIASLKHSNMVAQADVEQLEDEKASVEADLKLARQDLFKLREQERMRQSELRELMNSSSHQKKKLQAYEERVEVLSHELEQHRSNAELLNTRWEEDMRAKDDQLQELLVSLSSLKSTLDMSNKLKAALQDELRQTEATKDHLDRNLSEVTQSRADLRLELEGAQSKAFSAEARIQELQSDVQRLDNDLGESKRTKAELETRLASTNMTLRDLQGQITQFETDLEEKRKTISKSKADLENALAESTASKGEVSQVQERFNKAEEHVQTTQHALDAALMARMNLEEALEKAKQSLDDAENNAISVRSELCSLKEGIETSSLSRKELEQQLQVAQQTHEESQKELQSSRKRVQDLEDQTRNLESKLAQNELDLSNAHTSKDEVDSSLEQALGAQAQLRQELNALQSSKVKADKRADQSSAENLRLEEDLSTIRKRLSDADTASSDMKLLMQNKDRDLRNIERERDEVKTRFDQSLAEASKFEKQIEANNVVLGDLRTQSTSLSTELAKKQKELDVSQEELFQLEKSLENATSSRSNLERDIEAMRARSIDLESQSASFHAKHSSTQEQLLAFQEEKSGLQKQLDEATIGRTILKGDLEAMRARFVNLELEGASFTAELSSLRQELDASQLEKSRLERRLDDATSGRTNTEHDLDAMRARLAELQAENSSFVAKLSSTQQELDAHQREKLELLKELEEASANQSGLERDLQTIRSRSGDLDVTNGLLTARISENERELLGTKKARNDLDSRLNNAIESRLVLEQTLEALQTRVNTSESESHDLRAKICGIQEELSIARETQREHQTRAEEAVKHASALEKKLIVIRAQSSGEALERDRLEVELIRSSKNYESLQAAHANLLEDGIAHKDRCEKLEEVARTTSKELEALHLKDTSSQSKLASALSDLEELRSLSVQHSATERDLTSRFAEVKNDHETTKARCKELEDTIRTTKTALETSKGKESASQSQLTSNLSELESLRSASARLTASEENLTGRLTRAENDHQATKARYSDLEEVIRKLRVDLEASTTTDSAAHSQLTARLPELDELRGSSAKLTSSEKDLASRLAAAEEELAAVRETNSRLEKFLERAEEDMSKAETAFEDSEKRLEEFVEESQAKLDASRNAKLKYKRRLSERNNEIGILIEESSQLHEQIGQRNRELSEVKSGQEKLVAEVSEKNEYIQELTSSSDKRMRSMNTAYNELRSKFKTQQESLDADTVRRLEAELQAKDATIGALRANKVGSSMCLADLQQEVQSLREDKETFEKLVATLQDKIKQLETLQVWNNPVEQKQPSPSRPQLSDPKAIRPPTSPLSQRTRSSRQSSFFSQGHTLRGQNLSPTPERPTTQGSIASQQEDLDARGREVERLRLQRDDAAVQLRNNRKARGDLKKSLRESKSTLHTFEKKNSKRKPNLLRKKSRPSTSFGLEAHDEHDEERPQSPNTPSRPGTSDELPFAIPGSARSRHTIHFSPSTHFSPDMLDPTDQSTTSTPLSSHRKRRTTFSRPGSSHGQRPASSWNPLGQISERPTTSVGEREFEQREKRRWSSGLRKLFKGHE